MTTELLTRPEFEVGSLYADGFDIPSIEERSEQRVLVRMHFRSMLRRTGTLLLTIVPVAFLSSAICYGLLYLSPFNAAEAILGEGGSPANVRKLALALGTNRSYFDQYWIWLSHALEGNLGVSYYTHIAVTTTIAQKLPVDLTIGALSLVIGIVLGLTAGIVAALNHGRLVDRAVTAVCAVAHTIPEFWLGILLLIIFAVDLHVVPALGYVTPQSDFPGWLQHAILPAISLSLIHASAIARQTRTALVGVLSENFMVGARVRGLSRARMLIGHALRYAFGPAVTVIGMSIPALIGGAVIVEQVFGLPGIGQFAYQSAQDKDMPAIQGVLLVLICIVLACNVLVNIILGWLRPETKG
jgi:peptide/nickel transport system permease protein